MSNIKILIFVFCISSVYSDKLPSFIEPCSFSSNDLNECIINHGNNAWGDISKGDRKLKILKLNPLKLPLVDFNGGNIKLRFENSTFYGLEDLKITSANWDKELKHFKVVTRVENFSGNGHYTIDGKIMVLPIVGDGDVSFEHYGTNLTYEFDYKLREKDSMHYLVLDNQKVDILIEGAKYKFNNLFNGDKRLGDQMNKFLNENWKDFFMELKPTFEEAVLKILKGIVGRFLAIIPMEELFLE